MSQIHVKAVAGLKLPKEGSPLSYITEFEPVKVDGTHYYRKAIIDGDLVELSDKDWAAYIDARSKSEAAAAASIAAAPAVPKVTPKDQPQ